jgi:hypothetical protein
MTVLVGVRTSSGVVIGTDSSATFGNGQLATIEQPTKKIEIIQEKIIVAGTGQIGLGQRFCNQVIASINRQDYKHKNAIEMATEMSRVAIIDFQQTGVKLGQFGALVAFAYKNDLQLCEFPCSDFQPELKTSVWYASMGSGQLIADPFLALIRRVFWKDTAPSFPEAVFAVTWVLQHAIAVNPGGINGPMQIAVLQNVSGAPKARLLSDDELDAHKENATGAEEHLRKYREILQGTATAAPDVPKPT